MKHPSSGTLLLSLIESSLGRIVGGQTAKTQGNMDPHSVHPSQEYTLKEIAYFLRIYYTTYSKLMTKAAVGEKRYLKSGWQAFRRHPGLPHEGKRGW